MKTSFAAKISIVMCLFFAGVSLNGCGSKTEDSTPPPGKMQPGDKMPTPSSSSPRASGTKQAD